jgi:predicted Rossmann fold nucleotide-binding protein DprA/Smf involved in DNA uptake
MPDAKAIQEQVQERLAELEQQIEQLSTEFERLKRIDGILETTGGGPTASSAPRRRRRPAARAGGSTNGHAAPAPREPRGGSRAQQALELIQAQPGVTAADLAKTMGMKRNYLYRVLPALEKAGKVTKQGPAYHPAEAAQS